jgi:3alpha(or 20beta)-hydroxysteroid dehydrogenase
VLLDGKIAIVTGAARGTGAMTARRFVDNGARVVIADLLEDEGRAVAAELGDHVMFHRLDITDEASWQTLVAAVLARHGRVDILVNNAAVLHIGSIEHTSLADFRRLLDINTVGAFAGIRAVIGPMKQAGGGSIINVASVDALVALNGLSAYTASKWGLRGLTKSAALELGRDGIRVNAVCPAGGNAQMFAPWAEQLGAMGAETAAYHADRAIPRGAQLDEIADVIVFLAADQSRFVTGADIPVDGGQVAGHFLAGFNNV